MPDAKLNVLSSGDCKMHFICAGWKKKKKKSDLYWKTNAHYWRVFDLLFSLCHTDVGSGGRECTAKSGIIKTITLHYNTLCRAVVVKTKLVKPTLALPSRAVIMDRWKQVTTSRTNNLYGLIKLKLPISMWGINQTSESSLLSWLDRIPTCLLTIWFIVMRFIQYIL